MTSANSIYFTLLIQANTFELLNIEICKKTTMFMQCLTCDTCTQTTLILVTLYWRWLFCCISGYPGRLSKLETGEICSLEICRSSSPGPGLHTYVSSLISRLKKIVTLVSHTLVFFSPILSMAASSVWNLRSIQYMQRVIHGYNCCCS